MTQIPTFDDIIAAQRRIAGYAVRTHLLHSPALSERLSANVLLKPESLQRTGSFKFRGAWNAIQAIGPAAIERGVVAISSGNHALGLAEAGRLVGARVTIVMPADVPMKKRRAERSGARVVTYDRAGEDRDAVGARMVAETGGIFIHPSDDPLVIAGQGTLGLEIAEDCEALGVSPDIAVVACSGGSFAAGVALALKERFPGLDMYVAEPEGFDDYRRSLETRSRQRNDRLAGSVCDALLSPAPGAIGWEINRDRLAGGVAVSDEDALRAVGFAYDELRLVLEPGGAIGLAALLAGHLDVAGRTVVAVLSGGNVSDEILAEGLQAYRSATRS